MTLRHSFMETVRIGTETVFGSGAPANIILKSLSNVQVSPKPEIQVFRAAGNKGATDVVKSKSMVEIKATVAPRWGELSYYLAGAIGVPTGSDYVLLNDNVNTPQSYTMEFGTGANTEKCAGVLVTELSCKWVMDKSIEISVGMLGPQLSGAPATSGAAAPSGTTLLLPQHVTSVKLNGVAVRLYNAELSLSNRWLPDRAIGDAVSTFAGWKEQPVESNCKFSFDMERNSTCEALRDSTDVNIFEIVMSDGTNSLTITIPVKIRDPHAWTDEESIQVTGYDCELSYSATVGGLLKATLA